MSIPTRLLVLHSNDDITVESFFTMSYGTEIRTREDALSMLRYQFSYNPPDLPKWKWVKDFVSLVFYDYEFQRSELF